MNSNSLRISKIREVSKNDQGQFVIYAKPGGFSPIVSEPSNDYALDPKVGDFWIVEQHPDCVVTLPGDAFEKYSYVESEYLATKIVGIYPAEPAALGKVVSLTTPEADCFKRICLPDHVVDKLGLQTGGYLVIHPNLLLSYCAEDTFEACSDKIIDPS